MPRRSFSSRRLSLESLEERCNPAALIPMADFVPDPAPVDRGAADPLTYSWTFTTKPSGSTNNQVDDLQLGTTQESGTDFNLNAFAGQTVRVPIEAADAGTANHDVGGWGDDWITGGTGQDSRQAGAATGKLYVATNVGVFDGGAGDDLLIGGDVTYDPRSSGPATSPVLTLQGDRLDPAAADFVLSSMSPGASRNGVATAQLNIVGTIRDM